MSDSQQKVFGDYEKGPDQKWTIPNDEDRGVYRFILAAARRARQLQSGQRPLIKTTLRKSTKIAMEEIRCGAVEVEIVAEGEPWPPQPSAETAPGMDALGPVPDHLNSASAAQGVMGRDWDRSETVSTDKPSDKPRVVAAK